MEQHKWSGLRFPVRILTPDEAGLITPFCNSCALPGLVVELQIPLDDTLESQPLINFTNDQLKFYCAYHSPIKLPPELTEQTDFACYQQLIVEVYCKHRAHKKYITTCITLQPKCLKKCEHVHDIVGDVPLARLQEIIEVGRAIELRRKAERINDGKQEA